MRHAIELPPSTNPRVPEPQAPFRHMEPLQLRFNDIDALGHVNNSVYLSLMDLAKARYFQEVAGEEIDWRRANVVVANVNCDFFAPTLFNEPIAALTVVTAMGEKSLRLEQRIVNTATGEVKCVARTVMVGFDPATGRSAAIDTAWAEAFTRYEGHTIK